MIKLRCLGQSGYELKLNSLVIVIDPYLSNSVAEKDDSSLERLLPIPENPAEYNSIDFVLITHKHRDHCDEDTLLPLSQASPECQFIAPPTAADSIVNWGIHRDRVLPAVNSSIMLSNNVEVVPVGSAHPKVNLLPSGGFEAVGYILKCDGQTLYHAGDTCLNDKVITAIKEFNHIDLAFIPVNEHNYMKERKGIIGNMTIREAFYFAETIGAKVMVPTHWDMFAANQVYREEIELLYERLQPEFRLVFNPTQL